VASNEPAPFTMTTFLHSIPRITVLAFTVFSFGPVIRAQNQPQAVPGQSLDSGSVAPQVPTPDFQALTRQATSGSTQGVSRTAFQAIAYYLEAIQPNQGGIVWMAFLVTIMVAADFTRLRSRRPILGGLVCPFKKPGHRPKEGRRVPGSLILGGARPVDHRPRF